MTIWQIINLAISNTAIYKDCNVIIWRQLILANCLNSPISPNKSSPIINCFYQLTVDQLHLLNSAIAGSDVDAFDDGSF